MRERFGDKLYGRYGFADAFQPKAGWYGDDVIGIDVGIGMLMAENLRTGLVWSIFMSNPEAVNAMIMKIVVQESAQRASDLKANFKA